MREIDGKYMETCDVCGDEYQNGPGVYEGHRLDLYGGAISCKGCWNFAHDGWGPLIEPKILTICKERNVPIPLRNTEGFLPRE